MKSEMYGSIEITIEIIALTNGQLRVTGVPNNTFYCNSELEAIECARHHAKALVDEQLETLRLEAEHNLAVAEAKAEEIAEFGHELSSQEILDLLDNAQE